MLPISPGEASVIAKDAFIYGFPLVENYKTLYLHTLDRGGPQHRAGFNTISHSARVLTPDDKLVVMPNSDTPYSWVSLDLRAEPVVLVVPGVEEERYYSVQLVDLYTHNFAYLGSRTTGNTGGNFLIAGPRWAGVAPEGITKVVVCETELAIGIYRTQLFGPDDLTAVSRVQSGYRVMTLSEFTGGPAPTPPPHVAFPVYEAGRANGLGCFDYLAFVLQFAPVHPAERALRERFARMGIAPGHPFDRGTLSSQVRRAIEAGIADAWQELEALKRTRIDSHEVTSADVFGSREFLRDNYLYRFAGAKFGIYGNSREEVLYPAYYTDAEGAPLDGSHASYRLRFAWGQLPPVDAFWSVTMYDGRTQFLVANPIRRYVINSRMLKHLKRDPDGGLTLLVQPDSPGPEAESNWLPAPVGKFFLVLRLYRPRPEACDGRWSTPPMMRVRVTEAAPAYFSEGRWDSTHLMVGQNVNETA